MGTRVGVMGRVTWGGGTHTLTGRGMRGRLTSAMATLVLSGAAVTLLTLLASPPLRPARLVRLPSTCGAVRGQDGDMEGGNVTHGDMAP